MLTQLLFCVLGAIIGAIVGIALPIVTAYFLAALDGFEPGGNSSLGTLYVLLMLGTCPMGAILGIILSDHFYRTREWIALNPRYFWGAPPYLEGARPTFRAYRSLEAEREIHYFNALEGEVVPHEANVSFLQDSFDDYRSIVRDDLIEVAMYICAGLLFPPLLFMALYVLCRTILDVAKTRRLSVACATRMGIDLTNTNIDVPITLCID